MALTAKQERFVEEYLKDFNATQAAVRAGYSARTCHSIGPRLLTEVGVKDALDKRKSAIAAEAEYEAKDLVRTLIHQAVPKLSELMDIEVGACRFCHGKDHQYQETPAERRSRKKAHDALLQATPQIEWRNIPAFDEMGGLGYTPKRDPHPECPECFGDGVERFKVRDTRKLSPAARAAYAGFRVTKDGVEVKTNDATRARELLGRHYGLFRDDPSVLIDIGDRPLTFKAVFPPGKERG